MPRKRTLSFILELPLRTSPADERACAIMLDAAPQHRKCRARRRAAPSRSDARIEGIPSCPQDVARETKVSRQEGQGNRVQAPVRTPAMASRSSLRRAVITAGSKTICLATSRRRPPPEHSTLSCNMPSASAAGPGSSAGTCRTRSKARKLSPPSSGETVACGSPAWSLRQSSIRPTAWQSETLKAPTQYCRVIRRQIRRRCRWLSPARAGKAGRLNAVRQSPVWSVWISAPAILPL
jgi:hypothetical protein